MVRKNMVSTAYKTAFFIVAGFAFFMTATAVQAGFEWVPATAPKPAEETKAAPVPAVPAPAVQPAEPVPPAAASAAIVEPTLPMPGEEPVVAAPAHAPAPQPQAQQQPAPVPLEPQPLAGQSDMEMPQPVAEAQPQQTMQLPPPLIEAPAQQSKIKVLEVTPTDSGAEIADKAPSVPQQQPGLAPPPPSAMKVIMPEDAPETAMESTPNSEKLTIAPYPQGVPTPEAGPVAAEAQTGLDASEQDAAAVEQLSPLPEQETAAAPQEPVSAPQDAGNVVGFGSDIPLALALREVVPTDYAFSFGPGVNAGYRVSWTGDKPWITVVNEMVAPLDMVAEVRGKTVHISMAGQQFQPEQQSSIAPQPEAQAEEQVTALDGEPVPLMLHPVRSNISDPGQTPHQQPGETISRIREISASIEPQQQPELQSIEPASSDASAPQDLTSEPNIDDILQDISAAAPTPPVWEARKGDSLKTVLDHWSTKAGIELIWDASHDYSIAADISTDESFEDAVKTVTANTAEGEQPQVNFLRDSETSALGIIVVKDKATAAAAQSSI